MNTREAVTAIQAMVAEYNHIRVALGVMHWDGAVEPYPSEQGVADRGAAQGYLVEKVFSLMISPEMKAALDVLEADQAALDETERAMFRAMKRQYDKAFKIPPAEMAAFQQLTTEATAVWKKAKAANDFSLMAPFFEQIFDFQHKLAGYYGYQDHPYDALLDDYEQGLTVAILDEFFAALRADIVPLLAAIVQRGKQPDTSFLCSAFDTTQQDKLNRAIAELMGFDFTRGQIGTTEHPFMLCVGRDDVRMTTHYYEDNLLSALYSTLHEGGHALYELGIPKALRPYGLDDAASISIHESQSRTYENVFGRSQAFMPTLLAHLKNTFPGQFNGVAAEQLYRAVNEARASLIRIDADELTYCLHVMVRYEIEKLVMEKAITVAELPSVWNAKMQEILGVTPPDDAQGVLQDTHWPSGLFGYFPSYALGNAYSAQMVAKMRESVDVDACLARGDFAPLTVWLNEHVHSYGSTLTSNELIVAATGEPLNAKYYVEYLTEKFTAVYGL